MPVPQSTETNFERAFSDLAFARLRDKAPALLDHLVGFQLIDKNDEDTHAVGVFGFKLGREWIFAPVFFINGELKGHELLYLKDRDAFVPMTEAWVNYLLNRKPRILGEAEQIPRDQIGLRQPDFNIFTRSPLTGAKYASARLTINEVIRRAKPEFAAFIDSAFRVGPKHAKYASVDKTTSLPIALRILGKQAQRNLEMTMRADPAFADAVCKFYDWQELTGAKEAKTKLTREEARYMASAAANKCKDCDHHDAPKCAIVEGEVAGSGGCAHFKMNTVRNRIEPVSDNLALPLAGAKSAVALDQAVQKMRGKKKSTLPRQVVVIRDDDNSSTLYQLTAQEKEQLAQHKYVVHRVVEDPRKGETGTKVFRSQLQLTLQVPTKTGFYDIMMADGSARKLLVLCDQLLVGWNAKKDPPSVTVIDTEKKQFGVYSPHEILTSKWYGDDELKDWANKLPDAGELTPGACAILISPAGSATNVFEVNRKDTTADGLATLSVSSYWDASKDSMLSDKRTFLSKSREYASDDVESITLSGKEGDKPVVLHRSAFVPKELKAFVLHRRSQARHEAPATPDSYGPSSMGPGSLSNTLLKAALDKEIHKVQVTTDGIGYVAIEDGKQGPYLGKIAMLKHLIEDHGAGEQDALAMLKAASGADRAPVFLVKHGDYYDGAYSAMPMTPYFPDQMVGQEDGIKAPVTYDQTDVLPLTNIDNSTSRSAYMDDRYVDDQAKRFATYAANQGQKEVLDTAVIGGLVKTMDSDALTDSYMSDLLLALDRLGRILFMYYWHNDKFRERYGQQDMIELEDSLRNVFKQLGELTLFLKQKTIEPEAPGSEIELPNAVPS